MSKSNLQSLLFVVCLIHSALSGQWMSETIDDAVHYVCPGHDLVLPWNVTAPGEINLTWYYRGLTEKLIATMTNGHFAPSPAFSGRVEFLPSAGIILKNVVSGDKGSYYVDIVSNLGTDQEIGVVEISVAPSTSSGDLYLQQDRTVVHNDTTGEWSAQLTCGHFTSLGQPPVDVVWTSPMGEIQKSTYYNGTDFHYNLPNPVRGGNYSCTIVPQSPAASCLPGSSPLLRKAVVNVDECRARLTLMEARQAEVQLQLQTNANLSYIHYLEDKVNNLTSQIQSQENKDANLTTDTPGPQEITGLNACRGINYTVLSEDWRATSYTANISHCDQTLPAGWYRFKLNGANAVMTTSCVQDQHCGTSAPLWLDLQGQSLPGVGQQVQARSCVSHGNACCNSLWSRPVTTVQNCGTFYIYNLQPAPACMLAYCTTSH